MSRRSRLLSMLTASAAVLALGFVVAVASRSLPGGNEGEPLLDFEFRPDLDLGPAIAWILTVLAVLGAVLFALGLRQSDAPRLGKRRGILGTIIALVLFVVIARWLRPAAEVLLGEGAAVADSATEILGDDRVVGRAGGWLFSILLAAILAAALTRIGFSIRTAPPAFSPDADEVVVPAPSSDPRPGEARVLGDDPRSRILSAYEDFEHRLAAVGRARADSETTARHAWRAGEDLGLDPDDVHQLVGQHSRARYGITPPTEADAGAAERSATRLQAGIGR